MNQMIQKPKIVVGIDPGTKTGIAIWDTTTKQLISVTSVSIHTAIGSISGLVKVHGKENILVRVEDARKRKWFGVSGRERLQGAGSVKRDCKIWEDFLLDAQIPYVMIAPARNKTKVSAQYLKLITGWSGRTNEHGRDAAMLVYGH